MPILPESFRLYVFGSLRDQQLTVFAEHRGRRVVDRTTLSDHIYVLGHVRALRGYVDSGTPRSFDQTALRRLGDGLYRMIFPPRIQQLFFSIAAEQQHRAFELFVEDPELAGWPWEYLYDDTRTTFLCNSLQPVSRGIFTLNPTFQLKKRRTPIRLLLVLAVSLDDPSATAAEEESQLRDVFGGYLEDADIEIDYLIVAAPLEFQRKLSTGAYDIVHFYGHGRFDEPTQQGRLRFARPNNTVSELTADEFANLFLTREVRMVFLNACNSARSGDAVNPAISSVAAALLDKGIGAVVATQFPMPVFGAPFLSSAIYRELAVGKSLIEAVGEGRRALQIYDARRAHDWGIPVLFASIPNLTFFQPREQAPRKRGMTEMARPKALLPIEATVTVENTAVANSRPTVRERIGLADLDAQVGFLAELAQTANEAQDYFHFQVSYFQLPSDAVQVRDGREPQLYVPILENYLKHQPAKLGVDRLVGLTRHMITDGKDGEEWYNLISTTNEDETVVFVSTYRMREWASRAQTSFAKAVLFAAVTEIISVKCSIIPHEETIGCPFDFCRNRGDMVDGLRHSKLDHPTCRTAIHDKALLHAFDELLAMIAPVNTSQ